MPITFRSETVKSTILDPRHDFLPVVHDMEFRYDPLTGRSSRLAHFGAIRPVPLDLDSYENIGGFCPFCPDFLQKAASRFPADFIPEGTLQRGEAVVIANIAPYDAYSGVVVISEKHLLRLEDLTVDRIADSLLAGIDFLCRVKRHNPAIPYTFMGWNYMPPSGGGLVHAHIQAFGSLDPGSLYLDSLQSARNYYQKNGRSYWADYLDQEERLGERFLSRVNGISWIVPFAPLGIIGDVMAVAADISSPEDVREHTVISLAKGLRCLFEFYRDRQIYSFNASFHFSPAGENVFPFQVRISARTFLNTRFFPPDANFFQMMLQQPICVVRPEEISREIRPYFERSF